MEDDEFYLNDDELAQDNQLNIVDLAKMKVIDSIIKTANEVKLNLKFNEQSDCSSNIALLSSYISSLIELDSEELLEMSEEEVQEKIEEVLKKTTELTFANIDTVLKSEDEETEEVATDDDDETGGAIDF